MKIRSLDGNEIKANEAFLSLSAQKQVEVIQSVLAQHLHPHCTYSHNLQSN